MNKFFDSNENILCNRPHVHTIQYCKFIADECCINLINVVTVLNVLLIIVVYDL